MEYEIFECKNTEDVPMRLLLIADPEEKMIESYIHRSRCFLMKHDNNIIGVYVLLATRPNTVEIMNIALTQTMQGKGLGEKLLRHALETARNFGYKTVEIGTGSTGTSQLYLYQKCGFRMVGVEVDYFLRNYDMPLYENGLRIRDMVRLSQTL
ncbi:GNAT family N-acetyltransferase [Salicibibacter cibarius]|uniref:GNAT family N-acetyltransferase n=1 Tax=Salicibibacter cibarius TaxID=2743000 RepID=A0A7T6Z0G4_9BACI|nr:GNAT family N-acetyltransferase [Salicibibacter cibarius]QQK74619.1 GNAT family N-acetyltransferase [Salicibibacter cibarius]